MDEHSQIVGRRPAKLRVTYKDLIRKNHIGNLTGAYDRAALGIVYQDRIRHEDFKMWLQIAKKADIIGIEDDLAIYRCTATGLSGNKWRSVLWHYKVLRSENISLLSSLVFTLVRTALRLFGK